MVNSNIYIKVAATVLAGGNMTILFDQFHLPEDIFEGMMLQANGPQGVFNVLVKEIKETTAVLDANHPLAGKKLFFDLEVVEVM
jgi:FKBP-type peptidyl-prolyl cis-trans isomerase 2